MKTKKRTHPHRIPLTALVAAMALETGLPAAVHAQAGALEEVIVVARKREESLQETPIAVTALGAEDLRAAQITSVGDMTRQAPGLTRREGRKAAEFAIRGVGTRSADAAAEPGVGVYVDSIYIPRNDAQLVDVINMESIQVLRGPQGTLFGKNTIGGAILLTTKKPDLQLVEGFAEVRVGDLDRLDLRGGISGPIIEDSLAGAIILDYTKADGYRDDPFTGEDYGDRDRQSAMGQLRYQGEALTADLMLFYGEVQENTAPTNCLWAQATALQGFVTPGQVSPYREVCDRSWDLVDDEEVSLDRSPLEYEITNTMAGLTLAWEFESFTLKSITGYLYQDDLSNSFDIDATDAYPLSNVWEPRRQLQANGISAWDQERTFLSQEFQIVGDAYDSFLEYTVGAFYSNEQIDDDAGGQMLGPGGFIGTLLPNDQVSVFPPAAVGFRQAFVREFDNTSAAIFGQAILNLSDYWQLTLGARYNYDEKETEQLNYASATPSPGVISVAEFNALENFVHEVVPDPVNPNPKGDDDWTEFNPAITLTMFTPESWQGDVFDGGMLYASWSEGFKAGGFAPFGEEFLPFDPEEVQTWELGYKLNLLSNRARLNGAFYYSNYDDMQIVVTRTIPNEDPDLPPTTLNGIANAGEATIWGAELELSLLPFEGMFIGFNASYTDTEYDEFLDQDGAGNVIDRSDEPFAFIPEQTYTLIMQYDWMTSVGLFTPRVQGAYMDEVFFGLDPVSATFDEATLDDYTLWNFRLAWSEAVEGLELAAFVNNFTDEEYFGTGIGSAGGVGAFALLPGKQRTYGVEALYRW